MKILHRLKFIIVISYIFLIFCAFSSVSPVLCSTEAEAKEVIEAAESEVLSCYNAAFEAEKAGANVSELLAVLNEAGWLLSEAKQAYNTKNFDSASALANESLAKLNGFMDWAGDLKRNAEQANHWDFMVNFVGSGVGAVCVVACGFTVWTFLRKREEAKEKS